MTILPFKQSAGKNSPAEIAAEYGSYEQLIEQAKCYARDILCSCSDSDDPMAMALRAVEAYQDMLPAAFRAATLREVERLITEDY
jgi:hypothetical protein